MLDLLLFLGRGFWLLMFCLTDIVDWVAIVIARSANLHGYFVTVKG